MTKAETIEKPPYGQPCNSCGHCCRAQLCPLGAQLFGHWSGPCPALESAASGFGCGLVSEPRKYAPTRAAIHGVGALRDGALILIGAGHGCDALLAGETDDEEARQRMFRATSARSQSQRRRARKVWGIPA